MEQHPARSRLAEIVVWTATGASHRGSGYLVASGWVLTAAHVVAAAKQAAVWLGAPLTAEPDAQLVVDVERIAAVSWADLALLPVAAGQGVDPVVFGRMQRSSLDALPVVATGFPRHKLRPGASVDVLIRDLHHAIGTVSPGSNAKTGSLELTVVAAPEDGPEADEHSPWEGMSGAPVWAGQRLIGVVGQHHRREGSSTLTVQPVTRVFALDKPGRALNQWHDALPRFPGRADDLVEVDPPNSRDSEVRRAQRVVSRLAPVYLVGRTEEEQDLRSLAQTGLPWRWITAGAYAGKTALLAWFTLHPPPDIEVAACFLRRPTGENTADYALDFLTRQLAVIAGEHGYRPPPYLVDRIDDLHTLLPKAALAARQRGHRLMLVIDGLDEYDASQGSPEWLPDQASLPSGVTLVAASRSGSPVPLLPLHHPLRRHRVQINPAEAANDVHRMARAEIERIRTEPGGQVSPILSCLAMAYTGLSATELKEILRRRGRDFDISEIQEVLRYALGSSVIEIADPEGGSTTVFVFAHDFLLAVAQERFGGDLLSYYELLDGWAAEYAERNWPLDTPRYLLGPYARQLLERVRDRRTSPARRRAAIDRLFEVISGRDRLLRLFEYVGNPAAPDGEIIACQRTIVESGHELGLTPEEIAFRLAALALRRQPLTTTRASVASTIARAWARTGRSPAAVSLAAGIDDPFERGTALAGVARSVANRGDVEAALRALAEFAGHAEFDPVAVDVATGLAHTGHPEAYAVASQISDRWHRAIALSEVASRLCDRRPDLAAAAVIRAQDDAQSLDNPMHQADVVTRLAPVLVRMRQPGDAVDLAVTISTDWPTELVGTSLPGLAALVAEDGDPGLADRVVDHVVSRTDLRSESEPQDRALATAAISLSQAGRGTLARRLALRVTSPRVKAETLTRLLAADIDRVERATLLTRATETRRAANQVAPRSAWAQVTGNLIRVFAEANLLELADRTALDIVAVPADALAGDAAQLLIAAVGPLAEVGRKEAAAQAAQRAVDIVQRIRDRRTRIDLLGSGLRALVSAGRTDAAMREVARLDDRWKRAEVITAAALHHAANGELKKAYAIIREIDSADRLAEAGAALACFLATAGEQAEAVRAAHLAYRAAARIDGPSDRVPLLVALTGRLVEGRLDAEARLAADSAVEAASAEPRLATRTRLLASVAHSLAEVSQFVPALTAVRAIGESSAREREAAHLARLSGAGGMEQTAVAAAEVITDDDYRSVVLSQVSLGLAEAGERELAESTADNALHSMMDTYSWRNSATISRVARRLIQAGYLDTAQKVLPGIDDPSMRSETFGFLARELASAGRVADATAAVVQASTAANEIYDPQRRATTLTDLCVALARTDQRSAASATLENALAATKEITDLWDREKAIRELAIDLARSAAAALARRAVDAAKDSELRDALFSDVAVELARAGDSEAALETGTRIEDLRERAVAYLNLVDALGDGGSAAADTAGQRAVHSAAEYVAEEPDELGDRIELLREVANALAEAGVRTWAGQAATIAIESATTFSEMSRQIQELGNLARTFEHVSLSNYADAAAETALTTLDRLEDPADRADRFANLAGLLGVPRLLSFAERALVAGEAAVAQIHQLSVRSAMTSKLRTARNEIRHRRAPIPGRPRPQPHSIDRSLRQVRATPDGPAPANDRTGRSPFELLHDLCSTDGERALHRQICASRDASDMRGAVRLANEAARAAAALTSLRREDVLSAVARCLAAIGQGEAARIAAAAMPLPNRRAVVLAGVASTLAADGHGYEAIEAAKAIDEPTRRCEVLAEVVQGLYAASAVKYAAYAAREAATETGKIEQLERRCEVMVRLAGVLHQTENDESAAELAAAALAAGDRVEPPEKRCRILVGLVPLLRELGDEDRAAEATRRAVNAARAITDPDRQAGVLAQIMDGAKTSPTKGGAALVSLLVTPTAPNHLHLFPADLLARLVVDFEFI